MSEKHTPGPWVVDVSRHGKRGPVHTLMVVAEKGGMPGLIVNQGTVEPQDWANARLIASAPDLLEALEEVMDALRIHAPGTALNNHKFDALGIKAYAAIAKAKGG